jgi:hypothetical protein
MDEAISLDPQSLCAGLARLPPAALAQYAPKEIDGIGVDGLCNRNKFGHVDLALIALNHPDDGVRTLEPRRQITLREPGLFTCGGDYLSNGLSRGTSQCLQGVRSD